MPDVLCGLDVGTSSTKGVMVDPDGKVLALATRPHRMALPRPGLAEMDADAVWWADVVAVCHELLRSVPPERVAGVCVSGIGPCLVPADDALRPLRPAILYGVDSRATNEIDRLTERFGADAILARAGKLLSSQAIGPKLLWLRRHEPEVFAATTRWLGCGNYVAARLTGENVLDHHSASQWDPFYDLAAQGWATDWLEDAVGRLALPRLVQP